MALVAAVAGAEVPASGWLPCISCTPPKGGQRVWVRAHLGGGGRAAAQGTRQVRGQWCLT